MVCLFRSFLSSFIRFLLSCYFILFTSSIGFAEAPKVQIENLPTCKGADIIEDMRIIEPERYQKLKRVADSDINSDAVLWRIDGGDAEPSYLFGTMHTTDPSVTALSAKAEQAFLVSKQVAVEVADLSPAKMQSYMQKNPGQFFSLKGPKLHDYLSQDDFQNIF